MATLVFNSADLKELQRQCLHHNVFPIFLSECMNGELPSVFAVLKPIVDGCVEQLKEMTYDEIQATVNSIPAGCRMMLEPVEDPPSDEYIARVAEYCIAVEIEKGYSPVSDVVHSRPVTSEVLARCPELRDRFDDDGLLHLNEDFHLLDGGIQYGEYLLHYHQFLRRGFASNPNFNFLGTLARYRHISSDHNLFRVAIDHRRIMSFADYLTFMELDTWYGPQFDPEKLDDPHYVGLTVVGRSQPSPYDMSYPIVKTEFLWKTNEGKDIKTLEIEEISSPSSPYDNWHINRYVHAERDMQNHTFRHFDGAAKVYAQNEYSARVERTMPNNPRPSFYVKLFRIDGTIDLDAWLSLVGMFFKGNEMIIEYFDPALFEKKYRPNINRWQAAKAR